ncbi:MAG: ferritin-like domain-containing protein [Tepidimonas sp.]|uniref:ferritin-like domain-containing protein n=1 Tax=Tepidimonas sp. TaxID=2002775 RepID=UPI00298F070C|nr:ferritin-like domain-containing protein [Tepidimonas sp.]MCS6811729.1 ferritin-like domain-containing protein [Tepidimonas sp.]MCX7742522.1 ferritin-like domain-containing protein [Tepidimonas sp.]MDW8336122.1 ferritin-like domain-containing protein [Tepidimonas sp.]
MAADARVLGWLTRALQHEMTALQQYLAQSVLARLTGHTELAERLRHEALEELAHAERLMQRLIELGVAPAAGAVPPARLGRGVADFPTLNRQLEQTAVVLYQDAADHARRVRDADSEALLRALAAEEAAHYGAWSQTG